VTLDAEALAERARRLRALHHASELLVLPNAWDVASARAVEEAGFAAVATSSGAVSASLGYADADSMPVDEVFGAVARIARGVSVPLTADIEAGYGLSAAEVARRLLEAGAVGCNLEDTDHHGDAELVPLEVHADRVAGVVDAGRALGVELVVNARVDCFLRHRDEAEHRGVMDEAVERGRAYLAAGATCVYPIWLADEDLISTYVDAVGGPVNVMVRDGAPSLRRLQELGVARASLAGGVFRWLQAQLRGRLAEIAAERA
jgi:2-methylisocitrate lyase-like PEP mutase family enzyme